MKKFARVIVVLTAVVFLSFTLLAQAPIVRTGNTEVGGFIGASYGIDQFRVMGGGNVVYALTRNIMPYGEFSYFPGIGRSQLVPAGSGQPPVNFHYSIPLSDFHGGLHIRFPIKDHPLVPYAVIGLGGLHSYSRTEHVAIPPSQGFSGFTQDVPVPASTNFAVNFGGGLRYYMTERFGMRVEAKAYKPTGTFTQVFGKVEAGFFFNVK